MELKRRKLSLIFTPKDLAELTKEPESTTTLIETLDNICDDNAHMGSIYSLELEHREGLAKMLVECVVKSKNMKRKLKIPMALRYGDTDAIRQILSLGGQKMDGLKDESVLNDTRPLLFAAYHDKADAVKALLGYGVSAAALDRLILCELLCGQDSDAAKRRDERRLFGKAKEDEGTDKFNLSWIKLLGTEEVGIAIVIYQKTLMLLLHAFAGTLHEMLNEAPISAQDLLQL